MTGADNEILSRLADHADEADHADLKFLTEFRWRTRLKPELWRSALPLLRRAKRHGRAATRGTQELWRSAQPLLRRAKRHGRAATEGTQELWKKEGGRRMKERKFSGVNKSMYIVIQKCTT